MKIQITPSWAIARIENVPANILFMNIDKDIKTARRAYQVMNNTYLMTHNAGFRDIAQRQAAVVRRLYKLIQENLNLYYIVTKGFGLN